MEDRYQIDLQMIVLGILHDDIVGCQLKLPASCLSEESYLSHSLAS